MTYLTKTPEPVADVCPSAVDIYSLNIRHPHEDTVAWIEETGTEIVVSDCYDVDTAAQEAIAGATECFVVLQYDDRHELCCDILVNGHLFGPEVEYRWRGSEPTWCVGLEYLLLREEFQELAKQPVNWRDPPETALMTMGGSDVTNTTPAAMCAFDGLDLEVDVIIGPGYDNRDQITNVAAEVSCRFNLVENPPDLSARMASSDLAVSGFGTTAYELLAAGTPFVGIPVVDNQKRTARAFKEQRLVKTVTNDDNLEEKVRILTEDSKCRRSLVERYDAIIDGDGGERIFEEIRSNVVGTHQKQ
ncbi:pseudaminic acid biosynthesis-associated protein PseG [Natronorubrum sulfidifaciens JCM 14089]|uniref:Pseudaminic acid biosynthesis-associated protein PseG n=1 Tax=Natronorubrum sulfidifaciens JCM 14089 TaxID=1230460 RepID=L9W8L1_9EURY|nr:pseudaminic acid biosynthesis-associated protein PseG [Natronorubrum sulfidifaciens JCM 14089]